MGAFLMLFCGNNTKRRSTMIDTSSTRRLRDLIDGKHSVYLFFATRDDMRSFQTQAKNEWITFGDGASAARRKPAQIMRLMNDGTICFVGYAGTMRYYYSSEESILRIDYGKYMGGSPDYVITPSSLKRPANSSRHQE